MNSEISLGKGAERHIPKMCLCFLMTLVFSMAGWAQSTTSISGTIQDESDAGIPGATVSARNPETNAARVVVTDDTGTYRMLSLPVGRYELRVEKEGFETVVATGIILVVGQDAVINIRLVLGTVKQQLTVTAAAPLVNPTTAPTSGLVGERLVKDLPLNGRSFDLLITLNPATVNFASLKTGGGHGAGLGNIFSVSGRRPADNIFLLNGIEYTGVTELGVMPGGASGQLLGIEGIRELNLVTEAYSAEYGKRAGGQVDVVTASGTNKFHGTLFEFLRNSALDARNFFDYLPDARIPPFKRNQFGFSVGGPIKKDKTFLFGNYEGFRQRLGVTGVAVVPNTNARQGLLRDPANPGVLVQVRVSQAVSPYFALWPAPNGAELGGGAAEAFSTALQRIREDFFTSRLDHRFSEKDTLSGFYTFDDGNGITPDNENTITEVLVRNRAQVVTLEETHIFAPSMINVLRYGFSRAALFFDERPSIDLPPQFSFIAGRPVGEIKIAGGQGISAAAFSPIGALNTIRTDAPVARNLFTAADQLRITRSRHVVSLGIWLQRVQVNDDQAPYKYGQVSFATLRDFLSGTAASVLVTPNTTELGFRQWEGAWHVQDSIKFRPNLEVNLGLRHEFTNGWNEVDGRAANFLFGPNGALLTLPHVGASALAENNAHKLLSPRISLAWDPFSRGKTVLRAAFGTYYTLLDDLEYALDTNPPFNTIGSLKNLALPVQFVPSAPLPTSALVAPYSIKTDIKTPTVEEYSLKFEQELTPSMAVTVSYVGSHGYHLTDRVDGNTALPVICPNALCPAGLPNGTKYFPPGALRLNPRLTTDQTFSDSGYSHYNALQLNLARRTSSGLDFRANYTWSKGLDNSSALTRHDAENTPPDVLDPFDPQRDYGLSAFDIRHRFTFSGGYELPLGYGRRFVSAASGLSAKIASGWQVNTVIAVQSGFPLTPLLGFNNSRNGNTGNPDRPDLARGVKSYSTIIVGTPNEWFNPNAFVLPPAGTYGDVGRTVLRGPGLADLDFSLFKNEQISEKLSLQFRAEFFNVLNRANFGIPGLVVLNRDGTVSPSAGLITATATPSRQIQFGLKLRW